VIPVLVIEIDVKSAGWQKFAYRVIWSVFVAELAFVLIVAPRKGAALRAHWLDVAIVLFTAPAFGRFLASLRLVRLARLLAPASAAATSTASSASRHELRRVVSGRVHPAAAPDLKLCGHSIPELSPPVERT
jgi:hypothetical protein